MLPQRSSVAKLGLPVFSPDGGTTQEKKPSDTRVGDPPPSAIVNPTREGGSEGENMSGPFILGECLPPVPQKLVTKIQKGNYVEMAELLRDNTELQRRQSSD